MAQARRRRRQPRAKSPGRLRAGIAGLVSTGSLAAVALLLAGVLVGALATLLWEGVHTTDGAFGRGIRELVHGDRQTSAAPVKDQAANATKDAAPAKRSTEFSFFTVLPEIEIVAPTVKDAADLRAPDATDQPGDSAATETETDSAYMLQAGSFRRRSDADRQKANLALQGMSSEIQKVSIQGRGDFYRVRLGPYATYKAMAEADEQLSRAGIKALRLKMKSG